MDKLKGSPSQEFYKIHSKIDVLKIHSEVELLPYKLLPQNSHQN